MDNIASNAKSIESAVRQLLIAIGEDPDRDGLKGTPDRIARMYCEIFRGYEPDKKPKITTFPNEERYTGMVFDSGDYYSMCEHHVLPFFGKYYFAYIPSETGRIIGISKVSRVVAYCAARLQLQERLAKNIVDMLSEAIDNNHGGMAIVMKGTHLCKSMRGVRNAGPMTATYLSGSFMQDDKLRKEFYKLIDMQ